MKYPASHSSKEQNTTDLFNQGFSHYQAGRLRKATDYCQAILSTQPQHPDALHLLGMTCHQQGNNLTAIDFIKQAITITPNQFFYHLNLGNIYFTEKDHTAAEACYQKALKLNPKFVPTMIHAAENLSQCQQHQEAISHYKMALIHEPNNPAVLTSLGNSLLANGIIEEAIATLRHLVKVAPTKAESYYNLGGALMRFGDMEGAAAQFNKSLQLRPDFVEAFYNLELAAENTLHPRKSPTEQINFYKKALIAEPNHPVATTGLGNALLAAGMTGKAITTLRKLVKTTPNRAESYYSLGKVLTRSGKTAEAAEQYLQAIKLQPDYVNAYHSLGLAYEYLGRQDEAVANYRKALTINPSNCISHYQLAKNQKHRDKDADIVAMEQLFNAGRLGHDDRMLLAYGLGKSHEDIKLYEQAFEFLEEANKLKRATYRYNISADKAYFEETKKVYSQALFKRWAKAGTAEEGAIFVLGMPRSGTSLVEQILASNPSVYGAGELPTLQTILVKNHHSATGGVNLKNLQKIISAPLLKEMGLEYLSQTKKLTHEKGIKYIVDKMPHNFLQIGMIKLILPNAKIIHCKRHPMDNCLSIYKNLFNSGHQYAYNQKELGQYYRLYQKLMAHWRAVLPDLIYDISYEDLVADQEKQSRALFKFCGIPWDKKSLTFHKTNRSVTTLSSSQVRRPIYKDSVRLWRKYEDRLKELAKALRDDI